MRKQITAFKDGEITYKEPGNGLPKWVKELATTRGYADAKVPLSLIVTEEDIDAAFACAAQGDGSKCVMAQAGERLGAKFVYFYRSTAWVDPGQGPILRFQTADSIYNNVIDPYDKGKREDIVAGVYPLTPPRPSRSLSAMRKRDRKVSRENTGKGPKKPFVGHVDRVVMAAQAKGIAG
jgi:hypothetical protein